MNLFSFKSKIIFFNFNFYKKIFFHKNLVKLIVPHLLKRIHFNRKKPENHNVLLSNLKSGHIMLYDGKQWNTYNRDEVIDDIFDEKQLREDK